MIRNVSMSCWLSEPAFAQVSQPDTLLQFVKYLHRMLHAELPHATLLWYDSVTVSGTLNWQNKLNEKNM